MIVYVAIHRASGRRYVGKHHQSLAHRRQGHERDARRGSQTHFHRALRKYGTDAFDWEVIAVRDTAAALVEAERYYIAFFRSHHCQGCGFNGTEGGDGMLNPSEETRRKLGKGKPAHPNVQKNLEKGRGWNKGKSSWRKGKPAHNRGKPAHPNTLAALRAANERRRKK